MKTLRALAPLFLLLGAGNACAPAAEADAGPTPPADPEHRFDAEACESLAGQTPTDVGAAGLGVAAIRYELPRGTGAITLEALAPDESTLGTATIAYDIRPGPVLEAETRLEYTEGGETARQTTVARFTGSIIKHRTTHELGALRSLLWWTLTPDGTLVSATVGVPTTDDPDPANGVLRLPDGTFKTMVLVEDGVFVADEADVSAFVRDNGLDALDDSTVYQRLEQVTDDPGWRAEATARVQACEAGEAWTKEEEHGLRDPNQSSSALSCEKNVDVMQSILNADSAVGTARNAAAVTLALAAAGVVTTGAAAAAVFVISAVALWSIGNAIDKAVADNGGAIVSAPLALSGDEEGAAAVNDFFSGGGHSAGDPHLSTHDGQSFDFQAAGELVLVRSLAGDFEVQARQAPWNSPICPGVAYNRAIAVTLGAHRVVFDGDLEGQLSLDGVVVDLVDDALLLDDGGAIYRQDTDRLILQAPTGESLLVVGTRTVSVYIKLPAARAGSYEGLLGDFDGDDENDLVGTTGPLGTDVTFEQLHGTLRDRWAITADTSLFDYPDGEGPETWVVAGYPGAPLRVDDLPADARATAEETCADVDNPIAYEDCVLDIACALDADPAFRDEFLAAHELRDPPSVRTEIRDPVQFLDWTQEGPLGNGEWIVSSDGRSVTQTQNNDPTFFVSERDYFDTRIDGTLRGGDSDDDFIGFVFGYHAPLTGPVGPDGGPAPDAGTPDTEIDAFVVTWKGIAQSGAPEGVRLLHVHGDLDAETPLSLLWEASAQGAVEVLAEDIGTGTGWVRRPARFSLLYTADRIEVWLEGELRVALDAADSPYPFEPGRFGFFNYSQPDTVYSDFSSGPPAPEPARTDCTLVYDNPDATDIATDTTWGRSCTRYVLTRNITLNDGGALRVLPGTEVAFEAGHWLYVRPGAALDAVGTAAEPITFAGTVPAKNHWGGIAIESDTPANRLEHVEIRDTGASGFQFNPWALTLAGDGIAPASLDINHSTFSNHGSELAVKIYPGSDLRTFSNNHFADIDGVFLEVPVDTAARVTPDNTFDVGNTAGPAVRIHGGSTEQSRLNSSATWHKLAVPWLIEDVVRVAGADTVLTIEPGTVFVGDVSGALAAETGAISAVGTPSEPIVFTGRTQTPGAWRGLYFQSDLDANVLENVEIAYAGASGFQFETTALIVTGNGTTPGKLTLRNSTVRDSAGSAVLVRTGGTFVDESNTYTNNAGGDVLLP